MAIHIAASHALRMPMKRSRSAVAAITYSAGAGCHHVVTLAASVDPPCPADDTLRRTSPREPA
jgi:hypothetical protein